MQIAKYSSKIFMNCPTNSLNKSSTKYSIENLSYCLIKCIHIQIFDIFFALDSDSLPFSSPNVGYTAAVFKYVKYVHLINQMCLF